MLFPHANNTPNDERPHSRRVDRRIVYEKELSFPRWRARQDFSPSFLFPGKNGRCAFICVREILSGGGNDGCWRRFVLRYVLNKARRITISVTFEEMDPCIRSSEPQHSQMCPLLFCPTGFFHIFAAYVTSRIIQVFTAENWPFVSGLHVMAIR